MDSKQFIGKAFPGSGDYWDFAKLCEKARTYCDFEGFFDVQEIVNEATRIWNLPRVRLIWEPGVRCNINPWLRDVLWDVVVHLVCEMGTERGAMTDEEIVAWLDGVHWTLSHRHVMLSKEPQPKLPSVSEEDLIRALEADR